jgi:uncharacterized membrane protein YoaK (UPF0700 family)
LLPLVLSTTAGAVDVIGFLTLGGLFTAHITGNLVILVAHYLTGRFGQLGPLLSVPVFIIVLGAITVIFANREVIPKTRRTLLVLHALFLAAFLGFSVKFGPFANPDGGIGIFVGMLGVAAMAIQNALIKLSLPGSSATAVMTTNPTQLAVDLAIVIRGSEDPDKLARSCRRIRVTFPSIVGFVIGCGTASCLEVSYGLWAILLTVVLAIIAIPLGEHWCDQPSRCHETSFGRATSAPLKAGL